MKYESIQMRMLVTRPGEYSRKWIVHQRCQKLLHRRSIAHARGRGEPPSATEVIGNHTDDHDDKVACVKPKELFPTILRPPMRSTFFDKTATKQGFVNHMDDIRSDHEPERKISGTFIPLRRLLLENQIGILE